MKNSQKITLTAMLILNIGLMFLPWFGGAKNIQEVSGIIALQNPIMIPCILLVLAGLWIPKINKIRNWLIYTGIAGMIGAEFYTFLTWYTKTISLTAHFFKSIQMAFPEFWLSLMLSIAMLTTAVLFGYGQYRKEQNAQEKKP